MENLEVKKRVGQVGDRIAPWAVNFLYPEVEDHQGLPSNKMGCPCELIGLICLAVAIFGLSAKVPYQFKMTIFLVGSGIICLIATPFMIFRPKDYRNALYPALACTYLGKALGVTVELRGLENVKRGEGGVVLLNHQSALDLLMLAWIWPVIGRATVVAKRELLYIPFFGIGSYLWGTLFINRSKHKDSVQSLNKESKAIKERNCKLLLFPEGTRNSTDKLLPFKKGSFHIAVENQCPIQPVVISRYHFLGNNGDGRSFGRGHVIINILPEIKTVGYTKDNMQELIDNCRNIMQQEFTTLSRETKLLHVKKYL